MLLDDVAQLPAVILQFFDNIFDNCDVINGKEEMSGRYRKPER